MELGWALESQADVQLKGTRNGRRTAQTHHKPEMWLCWVGMKERDALDRERADQFSFSKTLTCRFMCALLVGRGRGCRSTRSTGPWGKARGILSVQIVCFLRGFWAGGNHARSLWAGKNHLEGCRGEVSIQNQKRGSPDPAFVALQQGRREGGLHGTDVRHTGCHVTPCGSKGHSSPLSQETDNEQQQTKQEQRRKQSMKLAIES